ncbi:restriction endonuclease subunit S [Staphylococcus haemolyticus]|uniref:restriction endonuclease subunit S n=1 Tax=Staphylococcus haemolyticus TaxID=1283 RepID=UPI0028837C40|nr:restriction endonuclease subunit S [Staphylococcus haemolyticus]MDT0705565.1 restriction endonuclease subunit S [Staphylococcus haemolyticus]MDT0738608.1 restriction endonuclease subunit S [Staphylococcus haemolyticus]
MTEQQNTPELRFPEFNGEWQLNKLENIASFSKGKSLSKKDLNHEGEPCILYGELYTKYGSILKSAYSKTSIDNSSLVYSKKNQVLIPSSGETDIDIATATCIDTNENIIIGGDLNILTPTNTDGRFISLYINGKGKYNLARYAQGKTVVHLYNSDIKKLKLMLPFDIKEQNKIGDFFSKLDRQIELEEKKLELLEAQKKGYMQKLFSQEIRFKDSKDNNYPDWNIVKIGDVLKERNERTSEGDMLSVTINHGIIKFNEIDRKDNSSKDKSNYKKVYKNDIAYNSMRMWQGASGKSEYEGIVSPAYTVTIPNENINPDFIAYYFKTHKMIHKFKINSQGLTSDTWNLKYKQLKDIKINLCSKEEQNKIANLLIKYDKLINKQKHKLEILKTNKKGLLRKMFI